MWIAVASLVALGVVSATSWIISLGIADSNGWAFYTPNSQPSPSLMNAMLLCGKAERILLPIAAFATAAYIYLSHRASAPVRGFEVDVERSAGGR
jgi:hypothetical protein